MKYILDATFKVTKISSSTTQDEINNTFINAEKLPYKKIGKYNCKILFDEDDGTFNVCYENSDGFEGIKDFNKYAEAYGFFQNLTIEIIEEKVKEYKTIQKEIKNQENVQKALLNLSKLSKP